MPGTTCGWGLPLFNSSLFDMQVVDAAISESIFNMMEGCVPEFMQHGYDRLPSGSTISGTSS